MYFLFLQATTTSVADPLTQPPVEESLSLLDLLMKGGFFMIPLILLSIIAVYLFVERYIVIRKASKVDERFLNNVRDYMVAGNISAAAAACKTEDTPVARMIEKGLRRIGKPIDTIKAAIENVGQLELQKLETRLAAIATISGVAPMVGFLGTVTGMIRAFFNISKAGAQVDPGMLAGGIYEAMLTTAAGLIVGIMAYIFYNILVSMLDKVIYKMEASTVEFVDLLQDPV